MLKALKRTLQELLGNDRWYGTLTKECIMAWIIVMTDREEMTATEEMLQKERKERKTKEKKRKRNKRKEQKRKEKNAELRRDAEALHVPRPW